MREVYTKLFYQENYGPILFYHLESDIYRSDLETTISYRLRIKLLIPLYLHTLCGKIGCGF